MQVQALCADGVDQSPRVVDAHGVVQLHGTQVREQHDLRCDRSHREGGQQRGVFEHRAAAAQRERDPGRFGRTREAPVDLGCALRPSGHRGDDQRRTQRQTEKRRAQVDVGERDLRQGFVAQPDAVPAGRSDIVVQADVEVP